MNDENAWLEKLKVGDTVILEGLGLGGGTAITTIKKITKREIETENNWKIRRQDGHSSQTYSHIRIEEATPKRLEEAKKKILFENIKYFIECGKGEGRLLDDFLSGDPATVEAITTLYKANLRRRKDKANAL